jgi:hypothetical protein
MHALPPANHRDSLRVGAVTGFYFFFVYPSLDWFGQATLPPHPPPPHGEGRKTFYSENQVKHVNLLSDIGLGIPPPPPRTNPMNGVRRKIEPSA